MIMNKEPLQDFLEDKEIKVQKAIQKIIRIMLKMYMKLLIEPLGNMTL